MELMIALVLGRGYGGHDRAGPRKGDQVLGVGSTSGQ